MCAEKYGFSREMQDAFAIESVKRAQRAVADGSFKNEIAGVSVKGKSGESLLDVDETPGQCKIEKIPTLKTPFKSSGGTVTAAGENNGLNGNWEVATNAFDNTLTNGWTSPIATPQRAAVGYNINTPAAWGAW